MGSQGFLKTKAKKKKERQWTPANNPILRELLDHLAQELAAEYVRIITEKAAGADEVKTSPDEIVTGGG